MIPQHFYTRGPRGYETVAKSPELSDDFIAKNIRPLCVYGGVDAITLAHLPCGKMLFGKATRQATGEQRAAFFMHNYIFPSGEVEGFLAEIRGFLHIPFEGYAEDIGGMCRLPRVPLKPETKPEIKPDSAVLPIKNDAILHIAALAAASVEKSKKTYVLLSPETDPCDAIVQIYAHLPDATKHRLGFCTAAITPEKRKNIHLIFTQNASAQQFGDFFLNLNDENFRHEKIVDVSDTNINDFDFSNLSAYIAQKSSTLSPEKILAESEFWLARTPHLREEISRAEAVWLEKKLDELTPRQILSIPKEFIKRGKSGESPELFVQLGILQSALKSKKIPPRYLLGSYSLSREARTRTEQNLTRILENRDKSGCNCGNVKHGRQAT